MMIIVRKFLKIKYASVEQQIEISMIILLNVQYLLLERGYKNTRTVKMISDVDMTRTIW